MPASLSTHVARRCAPCPQHAPRAGLHREPRPPAPAPGPGGAVAPVIRVTAPMSDERRVRAYMVQNGPRWLTARQMRQMRRMAFRLEVAHARG